LFQRLFPGAFNGYHWFNLHRPTGTTLRVVMPTRVASVLYARAAVSSTAWYSTVFPLLQWRKLELKAKFESGSSYLKFKS